VFKATYGVSGDADVTDAVQAIVHRNGGTLDLGNVECSLNEVFGDPNPGFVKKLVVDYTEGRRMRATIHEYTGGRTIDNVKEVLWASYCAPNNLPDKFPILPYSAGEKVKAFFHPNGLSQWYDATIIDIRPDGKYRVEWNDRDTRDKVKPASELRGITSKVRSMINGNTLSFERVKLNNIFGDTAVGTQKELVVDYIPATQRISMGEYEGRDIPGVHEVVSAKFGANGTWLDATDGVNSWLNGASLNLSCYRLNAEKKRNMWEDFGDPLPRQPKELVIDYIATGGSSAIASPDNQPVHYDLSNDIFGHQAMYGGGPFIKPHF
jgi:hypothetical protein